MAALSRSDAERVLRLLADAENIGGDQPFTPELLVDLGRLIEADGVVYHEADQLHRRVLMYVLLADEDDDEDGDSDGDWDWDWESMLDHPVCRRWRKDGCFGALRLSDVITQREFRRTRRYAESFAPWGLEYELKARLPSPLWHAKTFAFYRSRGGRDFRPRDRLVLELLTPHFSRLWDAARTRRLLNVALAAFDRVDEHDVRGVILLGGAREVEFASPPAVRLLREFFPAARAGLLPDALGDWLDSGASQPWSVSVGERRLIVRHERGSLLLEERKGEVQLTARERDVLSWVARGKTNAEVAELLWLAPSTVRTHLENVYAKLGVSTRTAAVARFLGLVDAESS